jgi:hypothetical protein
MRLDGLRPRAWELPAVSRTDFLIAKAGQQVLQRFRMRQDGILGQEDDDLRICQTLHRLLARAAVVEVLAGDDVHLKAGRAG